MGIRRYILMALTAAVLFTGCGGEAGDNYKEAEQNLAQGHYEEALEGYKQAVADDVHVTESWRGQGIALLKLNRCEEALKAFETALAQDEGGKALLKDIWMYKATAEYRLGDISAALVSAQAASGQMEDAQCYLLIGKLQLQLDQYDEAEASFKQAVKKDDSYRMYIDIYQSYEQQSMQADGEEYLKQALELGGSSSEDCYQRGRIYFFMGDIENARKELIEASNKGEADAMLFLGKVYLSGNDSANARAMYQQYMEQEEKKAGGYNGLALCDIAEGDYNSALENIRLGMEDAETAEVQQLRYNEVIVYEKMMDFATAKEKLAAYLELYPDDQTAVREYEFLSNR